MQHLSVVVTVFSCVATVLEVTSGIALFEPEGVARSLLDRCFLNSAAAGVNVESVEQMTSCTHRSLSEMNPPLNLQESNQVKQVLRKCFKGHRKANARPTDLQSWYCTCLEMLEDMAEQFEMMPPDFCMWRSYHVSFRNADNSSTGNGTRPIAFKNSAMSPTFLANLICLLLIISFFVNFILLSVKY